ncbi:MAG: hypothetical protein WCO42_05975 [bacterium]
MSFKICSCGYEWANREAFMADPLIDLIGYQVNFIHLESGFFLFNHLNSRCQTTLAIDVLLFKDLYHGEVFHERQTGSPQCPGYCVHRENLRPCPSNCECAYVREVMQVVKQWSKNEAA